MTDLLAEAVRSHGHLCPGQVLGVRKPRGAGGSSYAYDVRHTGAAPNGAINGVEARAWTDESS